MRKEKNCGGGGESGVERVREREREDERKREREKVIFNNLLLSSSRNIPILPIETTLASNATD